MITLQNNFISEDIKQISIEKSDLETIRQKRDFINQASEFCGYALLVARAIIDFEKELAAILIENNIMSGSEDIYQQFSETKQRMNLKFITFLTAARSYFEFGQNYAPNIEETCHVREELKYFIERLRNSPTEEGFTFRFVELLRNAAQHHRLPIGPTTFSNRNNRTDKAVFQVSSLTFKIRKTQLTDISFRSRYDKITQTEIAQKQQEDFEIMPLLRQYSRLLLAFHTDMAKQLEIEANKALTEIRNVLHEIWVGDREVALSNEQHDFSVHSISLEQAIREISLSRRIHHGENMIFNLSPHIKLNPSA